MVNKLNRNKISFHVSKNIVDAFVENILEKTPITLHDSSFEMLTISQTDFRSLSNSLSREYRSSSSISDFDIIDNTPTVLHINHEAENFRETESLNDNMFEKLLIRRKY